MRGRSPSLSFVLLAACADADEDPPADATGPDPSTSSAAAASGPEGQADGGGPETGPDGGSDDTANDAGTTTTTEDGDGPSDESTSGSTEPAGRSLGCGSPPGPILGGALQMEDDTRTFAIELPVDYYPAQAYPLVFGWHGSGGNGAGDLGGYSLAAQLAQPVIQIFPDGLPVDGATGWDLSPRGYDLAFFDALFTAATDQLCVDLDRVYTVGFSFGGYMSNTLACHRGALFRGVVPVAGGGPFDTDGCQGAVAAFLIHGSQDDAVPVSEGIDAREWWRQQAGCDEASTPIDPAPCVAYEGCRDGPVVWCQHDGGHAFQGWAPATAIAYIEAH
jgi:polyhydroxybutyrate depolymerase